MGPARQCREKICYHFAAGSSTAISFSSSLSVPKRTAEDIAPRFALDCHTPDFLGSMPAYHSLKIFGHGIISLFAGCLHLLMAIKRTHRRIDELVNRPFPPAHAQRDRSFTIVPISPFSTYAHLMESRSLKGGSRDAIVHEKPGVGIPLIGRSPPSAF